MNAKSRRQYAEFEKIIPWSSMGRSTVASQVGRSLLPIGVYDPKLPVQEYEGSSKVVTNQDENFESYLMNIVGTGILTGSGKMVTCLHVIDDIIQERRKIYVLVRRSLSANTIAYTAYPLGSGIKYIRPGERRGDAGVDLATFPFVYRDNDGKLLDTPSITWGDSTKLGVGDRILIGGYPFGTSMFQMTQTNRGVIQPTFLEGIVSAIIPAQNGKETRLLQLSTLTAGGMSGGAVFNPETGRVYGMVTSSVEDPNGALYPVTYAIPSEVILPFSGALNFSVKTIGPMGVDDPMWFDEID